ncbi:hypothetical protein [Streptomyces sp. BBFR102]|uniref:hypothetical protein n=1 Tax=Streptomyces sp. BBFR102 TaxID=3448171 RepID=UPI003F535780
MGDLFGVKIADLGAVTLLALVVLIVLTGRLVPRRTYDDLREERDTWRSAHTVSEEARAVERAQTRELLELGRTGTHALAGLREATIEEAGTE